jgi:formiminotetrahydrofolate cyclodeaminase
MEANLKSFLRVLDPSDNSTGGGTASAVAGAMAAALAAMVARLSAGKPGLDPAADYQPIIEEAEALSRRLFDGAREDSESFDGVRAALKMPKGSEAEQAVRRAALAAAMGRATEVPLENARGCRRALELCRRLEGRSNPNAASDLKSALLLAEAGLKGCLANVDINLPGLKDAAEAERIQSQAAALARLD